MNKLKMCVGLIVGHLILSTVYAAPNAKKCAHSCAIFKTGPDSKKSMVVGPYLDNEFVAIGGFTSDLDTSCIFEGNTEGVELLAFVNGSSSAISELTLSVNGVTAHSSNPGVAGKHTLEVASHVIECYR